jgi:hypothetical protein
MFFFQERGMIEKESLAGGEQESEDEPSAPDAMSAYQSARVEALSRGPDPADKSSLSDPVAPLPEDAVNDPNRKSVPEPKISYESRDTEELLHGLIAECHFLMRHVTLPSMCASNVAHIRREFLGSAMELVRTSAHVAETIGRLRHGGEGRR